MSAYLMGQVFFYELSHAEQAILLCMADHAHDDGSKVHPSIDRIVWKTGYEERQVKRIIKQLTTKGILTIVAYARGGRGHATEFAIHLDHATKKPDFIPNRKGDITHTPPQRVTNPSPQTMTIPSAKGDIPIIKGDIPNAKDDISTILNNNDASSEQVAPRPNRPITINKPSGNQETERPRTRATPTSSPSASHPIVDPGDEDDSLVPQIAAAAGLPDDTPRLAHVITYHRQRLVHADLVIEAAKAAEWIASPDNAKHKPMSLRFLDNWLRKVDTLPPSNHQHGGSKNPRQPPTAPVKHWPTCSCTACLSAHATDCACAGCLATKHPRGHDPACWCVAFRQAADQRINDLRARHHRYRTIPS